MEILFGLVMLYLLQAVLIYGMTYGHFKGDFPSQEHRPMALFMALFAGLMPIVGPALIFALSGFAKHGLRYK